MIVIVSLVVIVIVRASDIDMVAVLVRVMVRGNVCYGSCE